VQWLTLVILATQDRRMAVQGQPRQKVGETPSQLIKARLSGAHLLV
jgi:hypothetical protein